MIIMFAMFTSGEGSYHSLTGPRGSRHCLRHHLQGEDDFFSKYTELDLDTDQTDSILLHNLKWIKGDQVEDAAEKQSPGRRDSGL